MSINFALLIVVKSKKSKIYFKLVSFLTYYFSAKYFLSNKNTNMKKLRIFTLLAICIIGLSSCSSRLSPFTQTLYEDNNWSDSELKRIQFYLSDDIVLWRELSNSSSEIVSGEIKMVDGQKVEEIVIPKGTPGVMTNQPKENLFAISFEEGGDRFLMFGPNPKMGNRYMLRFKKKQRNRVYKVTYEDRLYNMRSTDALATLLVDLRKINNVSVKSRRASGRTIQN